MSRHLSLTLKILHFFSDYWFKNLIFNLLISLPSTRLYVNKEYQSERSNDLLIFLIKSLFQIYLHRRIQNPVKHLRWRLAKIVNGLKPLIVFAKNLDVWQDLEYASVLQAREKRDTPTGTWALGSDLEIPATFYVYGARIHKLHVRKVIKNADAKQG